jgi:hypothetical protein
MRRIFGKIILILFVLLILVQFIPAAKTNPPVTAEIAVPAEIKDILRGSCYDCHSNETDWPWYSKVAPVSWLVVSDVNEGRKHLNFSEWESYAIDRKLHKADEIWEEIATDNMPLSIYLVMHSAARLSEEEKLTIREWVVSIAGGNVSDDQFD